jgi:hypothetical protein
LRDHVAAESLADYVKSVEKIEQTLGFTVQKDALGAVNMARGVIAFLVIMTIAGIAIFGIMRSRLYKNNRRFGPTEPAPGAKPETAISLDAEPTISKQIE